MSIEETSVSMYVSLSACTFNYRSAKQYVAYLHVSSDMSIAYRPILGFFSMSTEMTVDGLNYGYDTYNCIEIASTLNPFELPSTTTAMGPTVATAASRSSSLPLFIFTTPDILPPDLLLS